MFDEENLISLAIFLSFCLSVHSTYVQQRLWVYVFFAQIFVFFRIIFIFLAKFSFYFFPKFSPYLREIFALFFAKISHYFIRIFSRNFRIFYFAKQIEAKFREEAKIFAFFAIERNAKTKRNGRKKKMFAKNAKFSRNDFSFLLETLLNRR